MSRPAPKWSSARTEGATRPVHVDRMRKYATKGKPDRVVLEVHRDILNAPENGALWQWLQRHVTLLRPLRDGEQYETTLHDQSAWQLESNSPYRSVTIEIRRPRRTPETFKVTP